MKVLVAIVMSVFMLGFTAQAEQSQAEQAYVAGELSLDEAVAVDAGYTPAQVLAFLKRMGIKAVNGTKVAIGTVNLTVKCVASLSAHRVCRLINLTVEGDKACDEKYANSIANYCIAPEEE